MREHENNSQHQSNKVTQWIPNTYSPLTVKENLHSWEDKHFFSHIKKLMQQKNISYLQENMSKKINWAIKNNGVFCLESLQHWLTVAIEENERIG